MRSSRRRADAMRYLRHEAARLQLRYRRTSERWHSCSVVLRPYMSATARTFPGSTCAILGWYDQKHMMKTSRRPSPSGSRWADWRPVCRLDGNRKLEYVDTVMREVGSTIPMVAAPTDDDLPVEAMHYTVEEHYRSAEERLPIEDERHFDGDLRTIFASSADAPQGERAPDFLRRHRREIVRALSTGRA